MTDVETFPVLDRIIWFDSSFINEPFPLCPLVFRLSEACWEADTPRSYITSGRTACELWLWNVTFGDMMAQSSVSTVRERERERAHVRISPWPFSPRTVCVSQCEYVQDIWRNQPLSGYGRTTLPACVSLLRSACGTHSVHYFCPCNMTMVWCHPETQSPGHRRTCMERGQSVQPAGHD